MLGTDMSQFVRENTRYPMELAVRVRCETWSDYLELYTTNLSRGGVFVASQMSAPIGSEMTVELSLPNKNTLSLRAEVVHLTGEDSGDSRPPGMGLMFIDLDQETRKAIEAMVTVAKRTVAPAVQRPAPAPTPTPAPTPPPPIPNDAASARQPMFGDVVEQSLFNELGRRLDLLPHEQLGVEKVATREEVDDAYRRLAERYSASIFKRYGAATQEVLKKINDLLLNAHEILFDPTKREALQAATLPPPPPTAEHEEQKQRGDDARRALKASIERRVEDACRHRDLGELEEAIRGFEAVLALDRKNDYARAELRTLREKRDQKDPPKGPGLINRLLKR